jgi:hypothetical protein
MLRALGPCLRCFLFMLMAAFKRIQFFLFPDLKEKVLSEHMTDERADFFGWNKRNLAPFFYSWKMVCVIFK